MFERLLEYDEKGYMLSASTPEKQEDCHASLVK